MGLLLDTFSYQLGPYKEQQKREVQADQVQDSETTTTSHGSREREQRNGKNRKKGRPCCLTSNAIAERGVMGTHSRFRDRTLDNNQMARAKPRHG